MLHTLKHLLIWIVLPLSVLGGLAACSPVTTLNLIAAAGQGFTRRTGIAYGSLPRQKLDIYTPTATAPAGGWPMVVFFYGGSWNSGERGDYEFVAAALASRGVLTLVADYRLYPEVRYPDFLQDSGEAVAYGLREVSRLGGDPKRVFVMGHSAGAYNAAMVAFDARWLAPFGHSPRELAGFIGLAGPYDFYPMTDRETQPVFFHPNYPPGSLPVDHIGPDSPRSFLGAAVDDTLVDPQRNTVSLATKLQQAHVDIALKLYGSVSHATLVGAFAGPLRWLAPVRDDVLNFIVTTPPKTP